MSKTSALELVSLTKRYGDTVAVDAINQKIPAGTYTCMLGPSGCGKSSTLRMIAGHESASSGDIVLGSHNITALPPAKRGTPLWFLAILVLFAGFGVTAAVFLFRQGPPPQTVVVQVPANSGAAPTTAKTEEPPPPTPEDVPSAAPSGKVASQGGTGGGKATTAPTSSGKGVVDLKGAGLLSGSSGGPVGGPGGGPGGAAGGGLDQAAVERVVASRRTGVKRTCWERANTEKSSASVMVVVTVAPNGTVQNASASGDDPVIAKCIENQVRTWTFPAPGSKTTVNIPFKFFRQ